MLLTGFEPFAGDPSNPSWDAVSAVAAGWRGTGAVHARRLPVAYGRAAELLDAFIDEIAPDLVIATGLASGRTSISLERVAINVRDARIPDNDGASPVDEPVVPGGPAAHFTGLPIKAALAASVALGLPVAVSQSAGTFVCNDLFYRLQRRTEGTGVRAGFVHVPATTDVPLDVTVRALESIVRTSLDVDTDVRVQAGALA